MLNQIGTQTISKSAGKMLQSVEEEGKIKKEKTNFGLNKDILEQILLLIFAVTLWFLMN